MCLTETLARLEDQRTIHAWRRDLSCAVAGWLSKVRKVDWAEEIMVSARWE